jgi:hypothetical protein
MAMPSTAVVRLDLSGTFMEFDLEMSRKGFIGPRVLRPRMVGMQAANVGKIPLESLLQTQPDNRASSAGYGRAKWTFALWSYATQEHGWEEALDDHNVAVFRDIYDAENIAAMRCQDVVMRNYELTAAGAVFNTATWNNSGRAVGNELACVCGTTYGNDTFGPAWSNKSGCTPIDDVELLKRRVRANSGLEPNAVILNQVASWNAANSDQVTQRIKYSDFQDPRYLSDFTMIANLLAQLWQVKHVLIAGGHKNTANQGQSAAISRIWSDSYVMAARVAETDDPREPCIGRTFMWPEDGAAAPGTEEEIAVLVEEYREEGVRGSVVRARTNYDLEIMYAHAGCLLAGVTCDGGDGGGGPGAGKEEGRPQAPIPKPRFPTPGPQPPSPDACFRRPFYRRPQRTGRVLRRPGRLSAGRGRLAGHERHGLDRQRRGGRRQAACAEHRHPLRRGALPRGPGAGRRPGLAGGGGRRDRLRAAGRRDDPGLHRGQRLQGPPLDPPGHRGPQAFGLRQVHPQGSGLGVKT